MSGRRWLGFLTFGVLALPAEWTTRGDDFEDGLAQRGEPQFWRCDGCPAPNSCKHITEFPEVPKDEYCPGRHRVSYSVPVREKAASDD